MSRRTVPPFSTTLFSRFGRFAPLGRRGHGTAPDLILYTADQLGNRYIQDLSQGEQSVQRNAGSSSLRLGNILFRKADETGQFGLRHLGLLAGIAQNAGEGPIDIRIMVHGSLITIPRHGNCYYFIISAKKLLVYIFLDSSLSSYAEAKGFYFLFCGA